MTFPTVNVLVKTARGKIRSVAVEEGRREAEGQWERGEGEVGEGEVEARQTERGEVHPVDGGPAPLNNDKDEAFRCDAHHPANEDLLLSFFSMNPSESALLPFGMSCQRDEPWTEYNLTVITLAPAAAELCQH
ncbi:hypothetical protein EYF80_001382 [Liparis tanakae]|uniref:Uncharacterized protein n=1 Tax=Liparis tanakae TaxID=230148 RepID=A0A4Z2JEC4_9TELE|nr:hypothetical protein EYF80_001382 [Liparis tanakae]